MRRALVVSVLLLVAIPVIGRLEAQQTTAGDTLGTRSAIVPTAGDPTVVRVTSRKLPHELGDVLLMNCSSLPGDLPRMLVPWTCTRRVTGTLQRIGADSIAFIRHGRVVTLASRDVNSVEVRRGRSAGRTVVSTAYGALVGLAGSAMIGIGGGYANDAQALATSAVLTIGGGAIAGYRGGRNWAEWR